MEFYVMLMLLSLAISISESYDVKIGLMLPKNDTPTNFGNSAGAVTLALQRIQQEQLLPDANIWVNWIFPKCEEMRALKASAELYLSVKVDVILGPQCATNAVLTGILGGAYNLPLISWAVTDAVLKNKTRFPTLISTTGTIDSLARATVNLLDFFEWHTFAIFYSDDGKGNKCTNVIQGIKSSKLVNGDLTGMLVLKAKGARPTNEEMDKFIKLLPDRARISIICMDLLEDQRKFMLGVREKGLDTDEYLYIFPNFVTNHNFTHPQPWVDHSPKPDGKESEAKKAFEKAMIIEFAMPDKLEHFKMQIPKVMREWPFFYRSNGDEQYGSAYSPFLFDAMYLYAIALNRTLAAGNDKKNGRKIAEMASGIEFEGMSGHVVMDSLADRQPNFQLKGFVTNSNSGVSTSTFQVMADFLMDKKDEESVQLQYPEWKIWANRENGQRPRDQPECGFKGEKCPDGSTDFLDMIKKAFDDMLKFFNGGGA